MLLLNWRLQEIPLIRKIIDIGKTSKGVILPKSWFNYVEQKHGKIEAVAMKVNGKLTIWPILKEVDKDAR